MGLLRNSKKVSDGHLIGFCWIFHLLLMRVFEHFHIEKQVSQGILFEIFGYYAIATIKQ